jgi:hypothetical protein
MPELSPRERARRSGGYMAPTAANIETALIAAERDKARVEMVISELRTKLAMARVWEQG